MTCECMTSFLVPSSFNTCTFLRFGHGVSIFVSSSFSIRCQAFLLLDWYPSSRQNTPDLENNAAHVVLESIRRSESQSSQGVLNSLLIFSSSTTVIRAQTPGLAAGVSKTSALAIDFGMISHSASCLFRVHLEVVDLRHMLHCFVQSSLGHYCIIVI